MQLIIWLCILAVFFTLIGWLIRGAMLHASVPSYVATAVFWAFLIAAVTACGVYSGFIFGIGVIVGIIFSYIFRKKTGHLYQGWTGIKFFVSLLSATLLMIPLYVLVAKFFGISFEWLDDRLDDVELTLLEGVTSASLLVCLVFLNSAAIRRIKAIYKIILIAAFVMIGIPLFFFGIYGPCALHTAVNTNHSVMTKLLIKVGLNVNHSCKYFGPPLTIASMNGNENMTNILIRAGADMNAVNEFGNSALILAIGRSHPEIVKMLLKAGADPNQVIVKEKAPKFFYIPDIEGWTPLMQAVYTSKWSDTTEEMDLLLSYGANIKATDSKGRTAFMIAAEEGATVAASHLKAAEQLMIQNAE